jgi:hypothetical protein
MRIYLLKDETPELSSSNHRYSHTSKGVSGHFPFILNAPGLITRPGRVNFPLQPISLAASSSFFSLSPPSKTQQEKATISWKGEYG